MSKARISRKHRKLMELELKPVLEAKDKRITELEAAAKHHGFQLQSARRGEQEAKDAVRDFLEKARAVTMRLDRDIAPRGTDRWRLVLDIDEYQIRRYFEWGNDAKIVEYLGQQLGHQAARTILTMNMRRTG